MRYLVVKYDEILYCTTYYKSAERASRLLGAEVVTGKFAVLQFPDYCGGHRQRIAVYADESDLDNYVNDLNCVYVKKRNCSPYEQLVDLFCPIHEECCNVDHVDGYYRAEVISVKCL